MTTTSEKAPHIIIKGTIGSEKMIFLHEVIKEIIMKKGDNDNVNRIY